MSVQYFFVLLLCFLLGGFSPARYDAPRVIDGDTFVLSGAHIRLWGIDAPEKKQHCLRDGHVVSCGQQAKMFLQKLLARDVTIDCSKVVNDRYRRIVARCALNGRDLGEVMVRNGWAVDYPRYSKRTYDIAQKQAMSDKAGMWAMRFTKPWYWRRNLKTLP